MNSRTTPLRAVLAALAGVGLIAVLITGCGSDSGSSSSTTSGSGNTVDAAFINDMIPHHQGAIDMAEVAQTRAQHAQLKMMAADIITAQKAEIATMRGMQGDLGHKGHAGNHMGMSDHDMGMDGDMPMLSTTKQFDKAFIDMMIPHHQGAIRMARRQLVDGKLPELKAMARNIIKAQTAEIAQMRAWRKQWFGTGAGDNSNGSPMRNGSMMTD